MLEPRKFSDELFKLIEQKEEFDHLVEQLTVARAHTMDQINQVARHFLGYEVNFRSKNKAAETLKQRQSDMVVGGAQVKEIERQRV